MNSYLGTILNTTALTADVFKLTVAIPKISEDIDPGQFYQIRVGNSTCLDPLLRRPISVAHYDSSLQKLVFVIRKSGRGTVALAKMAPGEKLDLFGPLGTGFPYKDLAPSDHALLIGGGVGAPPLLYLANLLHSRGILCTTILGFRSQSESMLVNEFERYGKVRIVTDDGSLGSSGNTCTELATCTADGIRWTHVFACGPLPMLRGLEQLLATDPRPVWVSLEKRMACGIGACAACTCHSTNNQTHQVHSHLVCKDGPVFRLGEVDLSE